MRRQYWQPRYRFTGVILGVIDFASFVDAIAIAVTTTAVLVVVVG